MRHAALPALAFIALTNGCVPPRSLSPTIESQRESIAAIRASYEADLSLLASQLDAAIASRRMLLLGRIDRQIVERDYLSAELAGAPLRNDLADAAISNAIIDDIRDGLLTLGGADQLLADYRAAESLTEPLGQEVRTRLIERLRIIRDFDATAASLRIAMADHAADIAWLFEESGRATDAIGSYAAQRPRLPQAVVTNAPDLWSRLVLARITDPTKRAAAEQLLADLLALNTLAAN